ncbi:flagellar export protein FliJ [Bacillus spongiae]|uniref:Flagellar FliJ protein n=1 Tax=Bacillus spongiae TaxID=2683610 RepID=A0ABU8HA33_9BACI
MKKFQFKFDKVLILKEQEKEETVYHFQDSVRQFEKTAEKLYNALKKKEDLETYQSNQLVNGFPVQEVRHYQMFITNLEKSIVFYQDQVIKARNKMKWLEQKVTEKNIEVKQYEKMKENDYKVFTINQQKQENKVLDELSVMKYVNREIR